LANPAFKVVFANRLKQGNPTPGTLVKNTVVKFGNDGALLLHEMYLPLPPNTPPPTTMQLIELTPALYTKVFATDNCGFDRSFRANEPVAKLYLEGHALLMDLASLWGVLKMSKKCHQALMQHPSSNAHLRDVLDLMNHLTSALRSIMFKILEIGEARFEQLVDINWATILRNPWIGNYRLLPKLFDKIEQLVADLLKAIGAAAGKAAIPIKEPKKDDKADAFVSATQELIKNIGTAIDFEFCAQKSFQASQHQPALELAPVVVQDEEPTAANKILNFLSNPSSIISDKPEEKKDEASKKKGFKQYTLDLITADKIGAGTDADVYCILIGTKARTGRIELGEDETNSRFEQGQVDTFNIDVEEDLGDIKELVLGHDNKGGGSDWNVKEACLSDLATQSVLNFTCDTVIGGAFLKAEDCHATFHPDKEKS